MLMLMPGLEGDPELPTTGFGVSWHADGALSRRQPLPVAHRLVRPDVMFVSRNRSSRTDVTSTPHRLLRLWTSLTPVWQPGGDCTPPGFEMLVHAGPVTIVWAAEFVTVKCPAQFVKFMSQNWGLAAEPLPGADEACSSGAFSSLESRLPLASDL